MSTEMKVGHTPGPWGLYGGEEPTQGALEAAPGLSVGSVHNTEPICRVSGYMHDAGANARLIAAAPDLLEALGGVEWGGNAPGGEPRCPWCHALAHLGRHEDDCAVATAIARATNES